MSDRVHALLMGFFFAALTFGFALALRVVYVATFKYFIMASLTGCAIASSLFLADALVNFHKH